MKKKILSAIKYVVFLGLGIFLIWWQLGQMTEIEKNQFVESLKNIHYIYLLPVVIMAILSHLSRAIRWKILIEPMGYHPSTSNTFYSVLCSYLANTFVPRAGEILRCTLLSRYEKIPFPKLIGTIIIERILDTVSYFLFIAITFLIQIKTVSAFIKEKITAISSREESISSGVKIAVVAGIALILFFSVKFIFKKYKGHSLVGKLKKLQTGLKEGFLTIIHLKRKKEFIAHTIFIWAMYLLQVYVGFFALSETSHLGIEAAFSVLSLSTLAMIISPGGIGAFPVAVQQVLLIYNLDNVSFGWLIWGVNTSIIIILGIVSFGLLIYQNRITNEKNRQYKGKDPSEGRNAKTGDPVEA